MPQRPCLEIGGSSLDQALSKMLNSLSSPTPSPVVSDERIRDQIRLLELRNEAARLERDKERQVGVRYRGELHEERGSDDTRKGSSKKYDRNDRYDEEWHEERGSDDRRKGSSKKYDRNDRYDEEWHEERGSDDRRKGSSKKYDRNDRYDEEWQEVRGSDIRKNDTQDQNDTDDKCNLSYNTRNDNMIK